MSNRDVLANDLLSLYRAEIRGFLEEHKVANLGSLDQVAELLENALAQSGEIKVGLVGEAQVGKSTLVNALLDRRALPSGGIGPLTAQATRVTYADENGVTVRYHGKGQLHRHAFAISAYLRRRGELTATLDDADAPAPDDESISKAELVAEPESDAEGRPAGQRTELGEYMLAQARRILCDDQGLSGSDAPVTNADLLLDGVRAVLGQRLYGDPSRIEALRPRIEEARTRLGAAEDLSESSEGGTKEFFKALRFRATGWISPLIEHLNLRLKNEMLRGMTLVDLPGIGIMGDPAGQEAEKFVRTEGDVLIVVLRNSGMSEKVGELLERTGVITKMLFGGRDDVPPIHLIVAVTHVDDVARERFETAQQDADDDGEAPPDRHELFRDLSAQMEEKVRQMVGDALRRSKAFEDLPEEQRSAREAVITSLCRNMHVACVASPDYLSITQGRDSSSRFLHEVESTGVPQFRRHLMSLAQDASNRRARVVGQFERALRAAIRDHLSAIAQMYQEGRGAAVQEWERFRDELHKVGEPLKTQMAAYHGEIIGVLQRGMQSEIELLCQESEMAGYKKLRRLSSHGRTLHYSSLRAALTRNGVWETRGVDYPDALTTAMLDSIASQWEPKIVAKVREEVKTLADRDLKLVEQLCDAARTIDEKVLAATPIESQKKILQQNSRTAVAWTKEQLEDLREKVSKSLRTAIERPIERACLKAVRDGIQYGTGAKNRILDAFEEGGEEAIAVARKEAEKQLNSHYSALLRKLKEGFFKEHHDPVQAALDTLTSEEVARARRSDGQRKRQVLAKTNRFGKQLDDLQEAINALPEVKQWQAASA